MKNKTKFQKEIEKDNKRLNEIYDKIKRRGKRWVGLKKEY